MNWGMMDPTPGRAPRKKPMRTKEAIKMKFIFAVFLFSLIAFPSLSSGQGSCDHNEHGFVLLNCPDRAIALVGKDVRSIRSFCGKPTRVNQKGDSSGKHEEWIYEIFGNGILRFYVLNGTIISYELSNLKMR